MTKLPGKLVISRIHSNLRMEDIIEITVIDDASGASITATMDLATFGLAVTGLGHLDVELDVRDADRFGWRKMRGVLRMYFDTNRPMYDEICKKFYQLWDGSEYILNMTKMSRIPATTRFDDITWTLDVPVYWFEKE